MAFLAEWILSHFQTTSFHYEIFAYNMFITVNAHYQGSYCVC